MSDKEDKDISVFSTRENLQQQFNKTADALEKITKMYFDMKSKNKRLLEALEELLKHIEWAEKQKRTLCFGKRETGHVENIQK